MRTPYPTAEERTDEVVSLRTEVARLKTSAEEREWEAMREDRNMFQAKCGALEAENARLRMALAGATHEAAKHSRVILQIARLAGEGGAVMTRDCVNDEWCGCPLCEDAAGVTALRAENVRLRDTLEEIADDPCPSCGLHVGSQDAERGYRLGIADGHRCAAQRARNALGET